MADVLAEIVARKRVDVAARLGRRSLSDMMSHVRPTRRSLRAALARPGARFVMEVKRASPSAGALREGADPAAIARAYRGAADAVSVLTDTPYFGGSLADLAAVRAVFDGPLLAKDFVIDARQIAEARLHGADAVLVMLSVLDDVAAARMIAVARQLGMDALVEAHDEAEVRRAVALGAPLIGINNRDLKTLTVDLAVTEQLAALVPADRTLVSESGIGSRADVTRLARHADAFLVGSSLMRAADPAEAARQLAFGRVKLCGMTGAAGILDAAASGAHYAGMVVVPGTPRAVTPSRAAELASFAAQEGMIPVAVSRDAPLAEVAATAVSAPFGAVQLHGSEDADYVAALRRRISEGCEIWAASAVNGTAAAVRAGADRTLFDTKVAGRCGGTGRSFDWTQVASRPDLPSGLLAGGIGAANAAAAARVGAFALDVGSGVEAEPGRKCPQKVAALFDALRTPSRGDAPSC